MRLNYCVEAVAMAYLALALYGFGVTLPDLPVTAPNPEPSLAAGMDRFSPPVSTANPAANAPIMIDWTKIAGPGECMSIIGDNLTSNTRFIVYCEGTAGGKIIDARVLRLEPPKKAVITLPEPAEGLIKGKTCFVWAQTQAGASRPMPVNRTDAWWVGPERAAVGDTIALHGMNLSYNRDTLQAWVYLKQAAGTGQWTEIVSVNPYRVRFRVPSLPNGQYEVWGHNGTGGRYGWSAASNLLTIYGGPGWTTTEFNVKNHGAVGDGVADDAAAIKAAMAAAAASPRSTVYFPAGTYRISSTLTMSSNMRLRGAGKTSTAIVASGAMEVVISALRIDNIEIRDMKISSLSLQSATNVHMGNYSGGATTNAWMINLNNEAGPRGQAFRWCNDSYIYIRNCSITEAWGGNTWNNRQLFIDGCSYYGRGGGLSVIDGEMWINSYGMREFSLTNNTIQDYNPAGYDDPASTNVDYVKRIIVQCPGDNSLASQGMIIGIENEYIAHNRTIGIGCHRNAQDSNKGEQILDDGGYGQNVGAPSSADATHITFKVALTPVAQKSYVYIVKGKGEGQRRKVSAYNGMTATIDRPWTIIPDSTSYCCVQTQVNNFVAYRNNLSGHDNYAAYTSASCGIQTYTGGSNYIADGNTIQKTRSGLNYWTFWQSTGANTSEFGSHLNTYFINNTINHVLTGVGLCYADWDRGTAGNGMMTSFGLVVRNTTGDDVQTGIVTNGQFDNGIDVFEKNVFTNTGEAVRFGTWSSTAFTFRGIYYGNSFSRGSKPATASGAVIFNGNPCQTDFVNNTFSGYDSAFSGKNAPGPVLELSNRLVEMPAGDTLTVNVWNAGTATMNWNAAASAPWAKVTPSSGNVALGGKSSVKIAPVFPAGDSGAVVTFSAGSQVQTLKIVRIVALHAGAMRSNARSWLHVRAIPQRGIGLTWYLARQSSVAITVHDANGRTVHRLTLKDQAPGIHRWIIPAHRMSSGYYLFKLHDRDGFTRVSQVIIQ